jgi:hypothetical protein
MKPFESHTESSPINRQKIYVSLTHCGKVPTCAADRRGTSCKSKGQIKVLLESSWSSIRNKGQNNLMDDYVYMYMYMYNINIYII